VSQNGQEFEGAARIVGRVGQIGCVTGIVSVSIITIAGAIGWLLDSRLGTDGFFTALFMIGSFPITLYAIVRISLALIRRVQARQTGGIDQESDSNSEELTEI
jgi:hypothetical protein